MSTFTLQVKQVIPATALGTELPSVEHFDVEAEWYTLDSDGLACFHRDGRLDSAFNYVTSVAARRSDDDPEVDDSKET